MSQATQHRLSTIECPKCKQTLPGWSQMCQFCGSTITPGYVRPVDAYKYKIDNKPTWTEAAWVVVGLLIVGQGAWNLLQSFKVVPSLVVAMGGETFIGISGAIYAALGLGMLFHQTWAEFIIKLGCILNVCVSSLGLLFSLLMFSTARHPWPPLLTNLWYTLLFGFTIYLINTEGDA